VKTTRRPCWCAGGTGPRLEDVRSSGRRGPNLSPAGPKVGAFSALCPGAIDASSSRRSRRSPWHGRRPHRGILRAVARAMRHWRQGGPDLARLGPSWVLQAMVAAYLFLARSWCVCAVGASSWRVMAAQVHGLLVGGARVRAGRGLTSSFFPRVSGSRRSCSGAAVYLYCFGGTISVLSWRAMVLLRRWLTCSSSSTSCLMRLLQLVSFFARVWFPTRLKALLGFADADHGDTRGCHFLLGGVLLGRTAPPLHARGNPRSALSDRLAAALQRRSLLEGVVLAVRALWLSETVASPV
jgi:hypothetical protein